MVCLGVIWCSRPHPPEPVATTDTVVSSARWVCSWRAFWSSSTWCHRAFSCQWAPLKGVGLPPRFRSPQLRCFRFTPGSRDWRGSPLVVCVAHFGKIGRTTSSLPLCDTVYLCTRAGLFPPGPCSTAVPTAHPPCSASLLLVPALEDCFSANSKACRTRSS